MIKKFVAIVNHFNQVNPLALLSMLRNLPIVSPLQALKHREKVNIDMEEMRAPMLVFQILKILFCHADLHSL